MDPQHPTGPGPDRRKPSRGRNTPPGSGPSSGQPDSGASHSVIVHGSDSALAADRASDGFLRFAHEMSGLIDGAMRYVTLARAGIHAEATMTPGLDASRQLASAASALERMAEMIHAAMRPCAGGIDASMSSTRSLLDAAQHAVEVVRPFAAERGVSLHLHAAAGMESTASGPLYTVLLNGVRNAVEACARNGRVDVQIGLFPRVGGGAEVRIDVFDDGVGPPRNATGAVFEPGYTTKPSGTGIGLSLCRDIVQQMGGEIELRARSGAPDGRGAHLRVRCPAPGIG
ncbi:MAG: sensor histidine kinase [Phycisphaerales bacterium]|nr:MAG: sensor histidine kinase [Phycisphaerales bacterium]